MYPGCNPKCIQAATLCVQAATLCVQVLGEETEELLPPLLAAAPLERAARHAAQRARLVLALALTLTLTLTLIPTLTPALTLTLALTPALTPGDAAGLVAQDAGGDRRDGTPHRAAAAHDCQPGADGADREPDAQGVWHGTCMAHAWHMHGTSWHMHGTCMAHAHAWCMQSACMAHAWHTDNLRSRRRRRSSSRYR